MIKLSRTKLDLFIECPRCFYLSEKFKISRPPSFPLTLNLAIDGLLKNEFDEYRETQFPHPIMNLHKLNMVPFKHPDINKWRNNRIGIQFYDNNSDILLYGAIDDIWLNLDTNKLHIVDYKTTATPKKITLDDEWKIVYKRQMEIYQWLFYKNGFDISNEGYFVYANGNTNGIFNNALNFNMTLLKYEGRWDWIENTLINAKNCLESNIIPENNPNCNFCNYFNKINKSINNF